MSDMILKVENVQAKYGDFLAVKHPEIREKLLAHRVEMEEAAMKANKEVIERFA